MSRARLERLESVFHAARAVPAGERSAFLARECGDDRDLRRELESLLRDAGDAGLVPGGAAYAVAGSASPADETLHTGQALGPYRLGALIGVGGMGAVYRARDTTLPRDVAVKILPRAFADDPERLARFGREARALAALNHPHIAQIYGVEEDALPDGRGVLRGLILELVDGETLAERLRRGPPPLADSLRFAIEIAAALEAAHERGIIHRDLKPANIKVTTAGVIKVLDFGLAKTIAREQADLALATVDGAVLGTPAYMSPEQARGEAVDRRADIWAFGCVLFELLAGRRAFDGATASDAMAAVLTRDPDWTAVPADTPPALRSLLVRCLAKEPRRRQRDAGDARLELEALAGEHGRPLGPRTTSAAEPRGGSQARTWSPAAVTLLTALATTVVMVGAAKAIPSWTSWPGLVTREAGTAEDRVAFSIYPPDGVRWSELPPEPQPAVSPDGQRIAFSGVGPDGPGIWVRELSSTVARPIAGTSDGAMSDDRPGAVGLFWSPDSRAIGYCTGAQLKLVPIDGQPPTVIPTVCRGDGSWSRTNEILFRRSEGLFRVSARGGTIGRVTTVDASREQSHNYPRWLPDGRRFIFVALGLTAGTGGLYLGSTDATLPVRILSDEAMTEYVSRPDGTGVLVFERGSRLVAAGFDPSTSGVIGEPTVLATGMLVGPSRRPSFSASAALLVHRSGAGLFGGSAWMSVDRSGNRLGPQYGGRDSVAGAALSRDERTLVYGRFNRDTGHIGLWLADLAGRVERPLFVPPHFVDLPVFAPDGRHIVFQSADARVFRLHVMDIGTGTSRMLENTPATSTTPGDWSPDGRTIVASSENAVVAIAADGSGGARIEVRDAVQPRLSPDGRWLAFTSLASGTAEVYVQRFPGGGDRIRVSEGGGFQPQWRGDGLELFYLTADGEVMAASIRLGAGLTVGPPRRLFTAGFAVGGGDAALSHKLLATRDGQRFLINERTSPPAPLTVVRGWQSLLK